MRMNRASVRQCSLVAAVAVITAYLTPPAHAAEAPFGFAWTQSRDSLPRPSSTVADANIAVLVYEGAALPTAMKDTELVALRIYRRQGLQQVRWVSRIFSLSAGINKFLDIYEEGARRHGEADVKSLDQGIASWASEQIAMRLERAEEDGYRIVMVTDGPKLQQCQDEYQHIINR
jgi:hypothetical protein